MTIRDAYLSILTELNKVLAPALLLDDFVYIFNKGVQEYYNERYNLFEMKQQLTDDLRVLLKAIEIDSNPMNPVHFDPSGTMYGKGFTCLLPRDYVHILNCSCEFVDSKPRCGKEIIHKAANKLIANQATHVMDNYYLKPSVNNPYYYITNVADPVISGASDTQKKNSAALGLNLRYGNGSLPVMQVITGDDPRYSLMKIYVDYLRSPIYYSLTLEELDRIADTTQTIEFPDYVTYEIINRIVMLILENASDQRLSTNSAINKTVA